VRVGRQRDVHVRVTKRFRNRHHVDARRE
jgi:hypothetical protein